VTVSDIVQLQTTDSPEAGELGWPESIKRHCREGKNVLIADYSLRLMDRCRAIEAALKAENVSVNFWHDGDKAWFIVLPPFDLK